MSDESQATVAIIVLFGFLMFLIALFSHPFITVFLLFATIIIGGILQTSGRGDGRRY